jgi:hypothetical protein
MAGYPAGYRILQIAGYPTGYPVNLVTNTTIIYLIFVRALQMVFGQQKFAPLPPLEFVKAFINLALTACYILQLT